MNGRILLYAVFGVMIVAALGFSQSCQFTIVGSTMTLNDNCETTETILIPNGFTLNGNGKTITAKDPTGGHFKGAVVKNEGATANVTNLTVRASGLANVCDSEDDRLRGILFDGASGSITNNKVLNINQGTSGCQEGNGIEVRNAPFDGTHSNTQSVTIAGNEVSNFQKNGITANGDVFAVIRNNKVTGVGPVIYIAQNGIQMGYGATGQIRDNTVFFSWYTGAGWTASGILLFEASNIMVQDNLVEGAQSGLVAESWCWFAPSASNNQFVRNKVIGSEWGVTVDAGAYGGYTGCNPSADNNKVVNNIISSTGGDTGVYVGAWVYGSNPYTPSATNNKVINNQITGFTTPIQDEGLASKLHANKPSAP